MSDCRTKPTSEECQSRYSNWRIMRCCEEGDYYFVGHDIDEQEMGVSLPISKIDAERGLGTTETGRVYELRGAPDHSPHAGYAWQCWMASEESIVAADVTEEVLSGRARTVQA